MENYRKMLIHISQGKASCNAIAKSRGISAATVRRAKKLLEEAALTEIEIVEMLDSELRVIFYPKSQPRAFEYPDYDDELRYIEKGYNLGEAHARYIDNVGVEAGLKYSAYCERIRNFKRSKKLVFRHTHQPGYAMQIDFAGYTPIGIENGAPKKFQLFIAVLPASLKISAIVVRSQSTADHIEANIHAIDDFGGVPERVVCDNLKAAVIRPGFNGGSIINPAFLAFADYYGMMVTPARVRRPQDKALVEISVKLVQRLLRLRLLAMPKLGLSDINKVLQLIVIALNERPMKRLGETREERFERLEKSVLMKLPAQRLEFFALPVERRVPPDYHIPFDKVHYSVPSQLVGKMVSVRASSMKVEIRYDGQPAALHVRSRAFHQYVTLDEHRTENHTRYVQYKFDDWRESLPPVIQGLVDNEINGSNNSRNRSRLMERIKKTIREYSIERLIKACDLALCNDALYFKHVKNLLKNNLEGRVPESQGKQMPAIKPQKNIRGSGYFGPDLAGDGGLS